MLFPRSKSVVAFVFAANVIACATIAGLEEPSSTVPAGAEPEAVPGSDGKFETKDGVSITPSSIDLPNVLCQATQSAILTIKNGGAAPVAWEVRVATDQPTFTVRGATNGVLAGTLEPGAAIVVDVDAKGATPGAASTDLAVKIGETIQQVPVKVEVHGGLLAINPPVADFGEVRKDTASPPFPIELKNEGNEPIVVTSFSGVTTEFQLTGSNIEVKPGDKALVDAVFVAGPAADAVHEAKVTPAITGPLCKAPPTFTMKGKRVNTDITVGPLTADFGDFRCNTTPGNQARIAVTNYATNATAAYEAKLLAPTSRFKIVGGASGSIPVAPSSQMPSKAEVVIAANQIGLPLGEFDEDLEVKITEPVTSQVTKTVKLHIGAYGAILEVSPPAHASFAVNEYKYFNIKNVGNERICVEYSDIPNNGFYVEANDVLDPNANASFWAQFAAESAGTYNYTINIRPIGCTFFQSPATLCAAPIKPTVSATR